MRMTTQEFIEKSIQKHGTKYDYSLVEYLGSNKKVKIICPDHGVFEQLATQHIQGRGCPECGRKQANKSNMLTQEKFIERSTIKHNGKYDYSKVKYVNAKTKVIIICSDHGEFEQRANIHLFGQGCPECSYDNQREKFSYNIEDSVNSKYAILYLTNSVSYYVADRNFGTYMRGDQVGVDAYNKLSDQYKKYCYSAIVTLTFDPSELELDSTSNTYNFRENSPFETSIVNGHRYVRKYSFKIGPTTSEKVLFYKKDIGADYTYPIVNSTSKVRVDVVLAS